MVAGRVVTIDHSDVDRYEELEARDAAWELSYSRPLTRADVGRRIVHLENGHNRSYAAAVHGYLIPVYDMELEEQSFERSKSDALSDEDRAQPFLAAFKSELAPALRLTGVEVTLCTYRKGEVTLEAIWSHAERNKGHGNNAMRQLCELADEYGVNLKAYIHFLRYEEVEGLPEEVEAAYDRLNEQGLDNAQLESWYAKHGFERIPGTDPDNPQIFRRAGLAPAMKTKSIAPAL